MPAGAGSSADKAAELEACMVAAFGPDFREKVITGMGGSFRLGDVFDECGLTDPRAPAPSSGAYGLFQFAPSRTP